jgi:hypothetical protein
MKSILLACLCLVVCNLVVAEASTLTAGFLSYTQIGGNTPQAADTVISYNGNVGIGTVSPNTTLSVNGVTQATGFQVGNNVGISTTCPSGNNWVFTKGILTACH